MDAAVKNASARPYTSLEDFLPVAREQIASGQAREILPGRPPARPVRVYGVEIGGHVEYAVYDTIQGQPTFHMTTHAQKRAWERYGISTSIRNEAERQIGDGSAALLLRSLPKEDILNVPEIWQIRVEGRDIPVLMDMEKMNPITCPTEEMVRKQRALYKTTPEFCDEARRQIEGGMAERIMPAMRPAYDMEAYKVHIGGFDEYVVYDPYRQDIARRFVSLAEISGWEKYGLALPFFEKAKRQIKEGTAELLCSEASFKLESEMREIWRMELEGREVNVVVLRDEGNMSIFSFLSKEKVADKLELSHAMPAGFCRDIWRQIADGAARQVHPEIPPARNVCVYEVEKSGLPLYAVIDNDTGNTGHVLSKAATMQAWRKYGISTPYTIEDIRRQTTDGSAKIAGYKEEDNQGRQVQILHVRLEEKPVLIACEGEKPYIHKLLRENALQQPFSRRFPIPAAFHAAAMREIHAGKTRTVKPGIPPERDLTAHKIKADGRQVYALFNAATQNIASALAARLDKQGWEKYGLSHCGVGDALAQKIRNGDAIFMGEGTPAPGKPAPQVWKTQREGRDVIVAYEPGAGVTDFLTPAEARAFITSSSPQPKPGA